LAAPTLDPVFGAPDPRHFRVLYRQLIEQVRH